MKQLHIAIAGNPNSGKTTLFNALTGSHQHVGNWPGVTVERIEGRYTHADTQVHATDLPGIYSFSAYSIDETVAREHILRDKPDVVVNIVDVTNLERNLFLTTQLLEMHVPVVMALSMMDVTRKRRIRVEIDHLAQHLGCPVVPIVIPKKQGLTELRDAIHQTALQGCVSPTHVQYDSELENAIARIESHVTPIARDRQVDARWLTLKLLEHDDIVADLQTDTALQELVKSETRRIETHTGEEIDIVIADGRYGFMHGLAQDVVHREEETRRTVSDAIDKVLLNRIVGIPIFLGIMYLVFTVTISAGAPMIDLIDRLFTALFVDGFGAWLGKAGAPGWLIALAADGVGGGIRTVATFVPPISLIFICLAFLEDSGYMARAAFVMDRFLRMIGLPGKAFIPMLVGFGCNVPAILATRTLENDRDRILTIMMNPFMSCGARLPVYALFVAAFFPDHGGLVIFGLYMTGILLAILTGLLFKHTILRGEAESFVMELPPYHLPTLRGMLFHTWTRLKSFMSRAGKVVIIAVIILSFLNSIETDGRIGHADSEDSLLSAVSRTLSPVFAPMGLTRDNWPGTVGLLAGLFAKEAVVGTLDALYSQLDAQHGRPSDAASPPAMTHYFDGRVGALAYLLFVLIYTPCIAAIGAIFHETSLQWAAFSAGYLALLAWVIATIFYQAATFTRHPAGSTAWIGVGLGFLLALYTGLKLAAPRPTPDA